MVSHVVCIFLRPHLPLKRYSFCSAIVWDAWNSLDKQTGQEIECKFLYVRDYYFVKRKNHAQKPNLFQSVATAMVGAALTWLLTRCWKLTWGLPWSSPSPSSWPVSSLDSPSSYAASAQVAQCTTLARDRGTNPQQRRPRKTDKLCHGTTQGMFLVPFGE